MPAAHRLGDICTGHECYPPRPNIEASPDVIVNGKGWHRKADLWDVHCCPPVCHDGSAQDGSATVFVNGQPACRIGDPVDCGSKMATGSPDVFAGG